MNLFGLRTVVRRYKEGVSLQPAVSRWIVFAFTFASLNALLLGNLTPKPVEMSVGQVAKRDVTAPRRVINRYQTDLLREEAAKAAVREAAGLSVNYEINQAAAINAEEAVGNVFRVLRGELLDNEDTVPSFRSAESAKQYIRAKLGLEVPSDALRHGLILPRSILAELEEVGRDLASDAMRTERIDEQRVAAVREDVGKRILERHFPAAEQALLEGVVKAAIGPNLVLDPKKVERAREQAMRAVRPTYVEQGQSILRKGDIVTAEDITILRDLGLLGQRLNYSAALGVVTIVLLLLAMMAVYIHQFHRDMLENRALLSLLGLTLVTVSVLAKVASLVEFEGAGFLIPTALAGILISVLLDSRLAVISIVFLAAVVGVVMGQDTKFVMVALAGGLASVFSVSRLSQRGDVTRAGLIASMVNFVTMIAFGLFRTEWFMVKWSVLGVVNGLISAVLAIGFLPYLETAFGITSSIRLLELSNPNHPLLRKLLMDAPGSYHHSMVVGNLAEAAAEAVGADSLLARVQAQYHDVGKIRRPFLFIENQYGGDNPHDRIPPSLSTSIILSHVRDGVELARQYKIPQAIVDIIPQHHGTDLVRYFYYQARENAKGEPVEEKDFRYPGPRPQSREAAIVMLADSVEAAVRSLPRPTPAQIEGLVRKIIKERLNDGQLDESDVTFGDLDKVADTFVRVLNGIFHSRIEYPDVDGTGLLKNVQGEEVG